MNREKEIIEKIKVIIKETHIINSALDAEDIEIVIKSLENREILIESLTFDSSNNTKDISLLLNEFDQLNKICIGKLKANKEKMENEFEVYKSSKRATIRKQKTQDKYNNPYDYMLSSTFDLKK